MLYLSFYLGLRYKADPSSFSLNILRTDQRISSIGLRWNLVLAGLLTNSNPIKSTLSQILFCDLLYEVFHINKSTVMYHIQWA